MKIGVIGTGVVGEALATALVDRGHNVKLGSRTNGTDKSKEWAKKQGELASVGTFNDAAAYGDLMFVCLNGEHVLNVIANNINAENLDGKIIVDVTNPLNFSQGMPPSILNAYRDVSLAEHIQQAAPNAYVVKALNTVNYKLMVDARIVNDASHHLFICGDNADAKNKVKHFLVDNFYWKPEDLIDLGGIQSARCTEAIVPFWVLVYQSQGTPLFNFKIVK
ncbi:MAG: NADP oxidoreductase [Chitinophagaceae bacterium]